MVNFVWPLLVALAVQPFMVKQLGQDLFGVLTIVGVTLGFFGVLDFGIGAAGTRQIAAYRARNEPAQVNKVISAMLGFYLVVGASVSIGIVLLAELFVTEWLSIPAELQQTALTAFYLAAPTFLFSIVAGAFASIPSALQRYDVSTKVGITMSAFSTVAVVTLLATGNGLVEIQILSLVIGAIALPIHYLVARRLLPTLAVRPHWDGAMLRELFSFGGYFLISTIGVMVLYQLDKLLVGSMLGVAAVTLYVVPGGLARQIQGLTAAATGVVFPMSAALFETDQRTRLSRLYSEGTRLVYILITCVAVPLAVFGDKFLLFWMGPEIAAGSSLTLLMLVITYYLLSFTAIPWQIANGAGWAKVNAFYTVAMATVDIGLFLVLVPRFGVPGAAASYLIAAVFGVPILVRTIERKVLAMSGFRFLGLYWRVGLVGVLQLALAVLLRPLCGSLLTTAAVMLVSGASFIVLYRLLGFMQESDRELLKALTARFIPKRSRTT
jgi:O-antigen/teichoic acid export membrane protein